MPGYNRYQHATPARDTAFNTFVPLPMEQLTALGMSRNAELQRNQELLDKAYNDALNIQAIPGSIDESTVKSHIIPKMTEIAMNYAQRDLTNPMELAALRRELRTNIDPALVNRIQESHAGWLQAQAVRKQLSQQGLYHQALDNDPATGWDSASGVYQYTPKAYRGRAALLEPYFQSLQPTDKGISSKDAMHHMGISSSDVNAVALANAKELASTPQGQDEITIYRRTYPNAAQNMTDEQIMMLVANDYGAQKIRDIATPIPGYTDEYLKAKGSFQQPTVDPYQYLPMTGAENVNAAATSKTLYSSDMKRSEDLAKQIKDMDDKLKLMPNSDQKTKLLAARSQFVDQKNNIDNALILTKKEHAPEMTDKKNQVMENYLNNMVKDGWTREKAQEYFDSVQEKIKTTPAIGLALNDMERNLGNPLTHIKRMVLPIAQAALWSIDTTPGKLGTLPDRLALEQRRKEERQGQHGYELPTTRVADAIKSLHAIDKQFEEKVAANYGNYALKAKQDMGIAIPGTAVQDVETTNKKKGTLANSSILLSNLRSTAGLYADIEDITPFGKILTKKEKVHSFIHDADNLSLDETSYATHPDGSFPIVITAEKNLGSNKTETKRFKIKLNENLNPTETQAWKNSLAQDLEARKMYKEADRLRNSDIEQQVLAGKNEPEFEVSINTNEKPFKFVNNGDGTYTEVDPQTNKPTQPENPVILTADQIIQTLYYTRNLQKYSR